MSAAVVVAVAPVMVALAAAGLVVLAFAGYGRRNKGGRR